jgi:Lrp/AsnC family leucine-responsive transcriptional regulator
MISARPMNFTKNEKRTLKLLIDNSRISDSEIAEKLGISSQAVGKIRRKLESNIIDSYTVNLNYSKLGIQTFAIGISELTREGLDKGELEIEQKLLKNPHVISIYRIPKGNSTHIILYGFKDMNELDDFFHSTRLKEEIHKFIRTHELYTFSHNSLLKNSPVQLFHKVIDEFGIKSAELKFEEIESFKRKIITKK